MHSTVHKIGIPDGDLKCIGKRQTSQGNGTQLDRPPVLSSTRSLNLKLAIVIVYQQSTAVLKQDKMDKGDS